MLSTMKHARAHAASECGIILRNAEIVWMLHLNGLHHDRQAAGAFFLRSSKRKCHVHKTIYIYFIFTFCARLIEFVGLCHAHWQLQNYA